MIGGQRDEASYIDFVDARRERLRRMAFAICGDFHQAEDLVQIALTKLYVAWPRIAHQGAEESYARKVILRSAIDESRRPWRRERPTDTLADSSLPADHSIVERTPLVDALQRLTPVQRSCVVLRHWLDLSVEQTAAELGISNGTVKSHTSRALARLQILVPSPEGIGTSTAMSTGEKR